MSSTQDHDFAGATTASTPAATATAAETASRPPPPLPSTNIAGPAASAIANDEADDAASLIESEASIASNVSPRTPIPYRSRRRGVYSSPIDPHSEHGEHDEDSMRDERDGYAEHIEDAQTTNRRRTAQQPQVQPTNAREGRFSEEGIVHGRDVLIRAATAPADGGLERDEEEDEPGRWNGRGSGRGYRRSRLGMFRRWRRGSSADLPAPPSPSSSTEPLHPPIRRGPYEPLDTRRRSIMPQKGALKKYLTAPAGAATSLSGRRAGGPGGSKNVVWPRDTRGGSVDSEAGKTGIRAALRRLFGRAEPAPSVPGRVGREVGGARRDSAYPTAKEMGAKERRGER